MVAVMMHRGHMTALPQMKVDLVKLKGVFNRLLDLLPNTLSNPARCENRLAFALIAVGVVWYCNGHS